MNVPFSSGSLRPRPDETAVPFIDRIRTVHGGPVAADGIKILQVNLGYRCNMTCAHCHVSAGPGRSEIMNVETVALVLKVLRENPVRALDITGGAPELNPSFRFLVREARKTGKQVIVRTNLTVFFEPGMKDLPDFYRDQEIDLVASLPCYLEQNVDTPRGSGTFRKSIEALQRLNELGYGREDFDSLPLSLVYNPAGPFLPPSQSALESDYKRELKTLFGIFFTRLYTFTNMPIGRFRRSLVGKGESEQYSKLLASAFNPATVGRIMCRGILSVGWDGMLSDCDFNQVLGTPVTPEAHRHIRDFDYHALARRTIAVDDHCYGCTAGQGST